MIRFAMVLLLNAVRLIYMIPIMKYWAKHPEKYSEEKRYKLARYIVASMKITGWIRTEVYGTENLPKEGGYTMYPNHQGRYDAYGIVSVHKKPCTVVMDEAKSHFPVVNELLDMMQAKRLDKTDIRQGLTIIKQVAKEVGEGRRYILFPEGDYLVKNKNTMSDFKAGCFKISTMSKTPIVPVALVDSYKVFNGVLSTPVVTSQVHFLEPIYYEEYQGMKTVEIADLVMSRIQEKLDEVLENS